MTDNKYLNTLKEKLTSRLAELSKQMAGEQNKDAKVPPMEILLKTAMKNEWESVLLTSHWITDEKDSEFRIALARLAGDEAKHFSLIEKRLSGLDDKLSTEELDIRTPLYHFLAKQKNTFDRVLTGPYVREALAVERNKIFLEHCEKIEDLETISIYEQIQQDEYHHHELGEKLLGKLIQNEDDLKRSENLMNDMLKVVDDIQEMILIKKGICKLPGC